METQQPPGQIYLCPMHRDVRMPAPGKCPKYDMDMIPEGTRFALLRHMLGKPMHIATMLAVMLALMALVMLI